ncbi:hypothetical protein F511_37837 [Dorcoceras hygrometricum]|uniref:Uncharacterized protein n=1 Tax=Dorcoceras hygrometricum TaxID=472368 RepID=A0A2Z7CB32_9LAMI|nr:hypothetical protein F511_37837 [Dorcoceras hygrometricum]
MANQIKRRNVSSLTYENFPGEQGSTSTDTMNAAATPMETLLKRFQSFKPPTLTGTENAIDCENWLEDIEQLFEALDYTNDRRVKLIVLMTRYSILRSQNRVADEWAVTRPNGINRWIGYKSKGCDENLCSSERDDWAVTWLRCGHSGG